MNLAYFPFDSQMCTVEIESFGYTMADLKYRCSQLNYAAVTQVIMHADQLQLFVLKPVSPSL